MDELGHLDRYHHRRSIGRQFVRFNTCRRIGATEHDFGTRRKMAPGCDFLLCEATALDPADVSRQNSVSHQRGHMAIKFRIKKSAGVPVTARIHRLIARGDEARGQRDWAAARDAYQLALNSDANLGHIWVQLGHSLKELGLIAEAEKAYRRAVALLPNQSDPWFHLGTISKMSGDLLAASRQYARSANLDPRNSDAVGELHRLIGQTSVMSRDAVAKVLSEEGIIEPIAGVVADSSIRSGRAALRSILSEMIVDDELATIFHNALDALDMIENEQFEGRVKKIPKPDGLNLIFDITDLISYFSEARLPTGIQRVQIEIISEALILYQDYIKICCFMDGRDGWFEVPISIFNHLSALSTISSALEDDYWVGALNKLRLSLSLSEPFVFPNGAYLINLGTSWRFLNYFLFVRDAKSKYNIRYIPLIHDFIPIIAPEYCTKGLTQDFIAWCLGVFEHADHFFVNSEATKSDLFKVAKTLGYSVDVSKITVIRLDGAFRARKKQSPATGRALAKWGLADRPFALFVSTVESRKGHTVAIDAWLSLVRDYGADKIPRLVCVGNRGWLNDEVFKRLEHNDVLESCVKMLSHISDAEIDILYRSCQFTIYPSLYEGWGLPVTEALCYGKPVIASDSSSLPEAGGDFALYVEKGSVVQLAAAVAKMAFDSDYRTALETKIAAGFRPRLWSAIAEQIKTEILQLAKRNAENDRPWTLAVVKLGAYYPIARNVQTRIWPGLGSGEIFRTGTGWHWPEPWGCWTRPEGGDLEIGLPASGDAFRVYFLLRNIPNHQCEWRMAVKGKFTLRGVLKPGEDKWISFEFDAANPGDVIKLHISGLRAETAELNSGGFINNQHISVGVMGFYICPTHDAAARFELLEATTLGNIDDLNIFREKVIF